MPARRPGAVGQNRPQALDLLVKVGEPGVMPGVDVRVAAGQAKQEVRPAAAVRGRPGAGRLIRAVRGRGLLMAGVRIIGQTAAEGSSPGLAEASRAPSSKTFCEARWTCSSGRT